MTWEPFDAVATGFAVGMIFAALLLSIVLTMVGRLIRKQAKRSASLAERAKAEAKSRYVRLEFPDTYTDGEYDEFWVKVVELAEDTRRAKEATTDEDAIIWVSGGGHVGSNTRSAEVMPE